MRTPPFHPYKTKSIVFMWIVFQCDHFRKSIMFLIQSDFGFDFLIFISIWKKISSIGEQNRSIVFWWIKSDWRWFIFSPKQWIKLAGINCIRIIFIGTRALAHLTSKRNTSMQEQKSHTKMQQRLRIGMATLRLNRYKTISTLFLYVRMCILTIYMYDIVSYSWIEKKTT